MQREQPFDNLYFNKQAAVHWFKSREEQAEMLSDNISINSFSLIRGC